MKNIITQSIGGCVRAANTPGSQREPGYHPQITLRATILLLLASAMLIYLTGCAGGGVFQNPQGATAVAQYVARNVTRKVLEKNPDALAKFEKARNALAVLELSDPIDALTVVKIIESLPVQELQTADAQMYIEGGALVLILLGDPAVKTDTAERTRQITHGLVLGLTEGLDWFKAFKAKPGATLGGPARAASRPVRSANGPA